MIYPADGSTVTYLPCQLSSMSHHDSSAAFLINVPLLTFHLHDVNLASTFSFSSLLVQEGMNCTDEEKGQSSIFL